jgi:ComF family protein
VKGFLRLLQDLIFPPCCIGCGERISPCVAKNENPYFCAACAKKWENDRLSQCPDCYAAYCDCRCRPDIMRRAGVVSLVKLAPYHGERGHSVTECVIRGMKREPRRRSFECCADSLAPLLLSALDEMEQKVPISHTVVAHLPRSRRNARLYGFDQSKGVAQRLARHLGLEYTSLLRRVHDGTEQKRLGVAARRKNVKGAFALRGSVKGLRVILVDDIVTTGAGMAEAVRTLRRGGAAQILCVAVAATPKEKRSERKIP